MKNRSVVPMRIAKIGYIVMSAVLCVVGILFMIFPQLSSIIIGRALGIVMILFGGVKLVGYFSKDLFRLAFQYDLEFGLLLIILGTIVLVRFSDIMNFIFIAIGIAILTDGLFKIQISVDSKKFGIKSWWMVMLFALLTSVVGLILVFRPVESIYVLTVLLGISLLSEGILNLFVAICTVSIIKYQKPDIIEVDYSREE